MKKVMFVMAVAGMFAFAACNNSKPAEVVEATEPVAEAVENAAQETSECCQQAAAECAEAVENAAEEVSEAVAQ